MYFCLFTFGRNMCITISLRIGVWGMMYTMIVDFDPCPMFENG